MTTPTNTPDQAASEREKVEGLNSWQFIKYVQSVIPRHLHLMAIEVADKEGSSSFTTTVPDDEIIARLENQQ